MLLESGISGINVLFDANRACAECALRDDCRGPVPAEGPMDARVAFIGEAQGPTRTRLASHSGGPLVDILTPSSGAWG